jgi:hypothetical protein
MSYHRKIVLPGEISKHGGFGLGDTASAIAVANDVLHDPYFNEALCRVKQLQAIENKKTVPACVVTPPNISGGVGLRKAMPIVRAYVYAERQPLKWPLIAAVVGVLGVPALIGYSIAKGGR